MYMFVLIFLFITVFEKKSYFEVQKVAKSEDCVMKKKFYSQNLKKMCYYEGERSKDIFM